jgi:hypothetical protein
MWSGLLCWIEGVLMGTDNRPWTGTVTVSEGKIVSAVPFGPQPCEVSPPGDMRDWTAAMSVLELLDGDKKDVLLPSLQRWILLATEGKTPLVSEPVAGKGGAA